MIVLTVYVVIEDKRDFTEFKQYKTAKKRLTFYKKWLTKSYLLVGLPAIVYLLFTENFRRLNNPFWTNSTIKYLHVEIVEKNPWVLIGGLNIGILVGWILQGMITYKKTRWSNSEKTATIGDVQAILPKNSNERRYGFLLAISAGINEELLFRVAIPLILLSLGLSPLAAGVLSILWFGCMHIYQGIFGVFGASLAGAGLMAMYIVTGSIFAPIIFHASIDLNALIIQPYIAKKSLRT